MKYLIRSNKFYSAVFMFFSLIAFNQASASTYYGTNYCYYSGSYVIMATNTLESPDDTNYSVVARTYHWKYPGNIRLNSTSGDPKYGNYNITSQKFYLSSSGSTYSTFGGHDKLHSSGVLFTNVTSSSRADC